MKVAVVTGASGGIGKAIVKEFVEKGYFVLAQYSKNRQAIDELKNQLKTQNLCEYIAPIQADFSKLEEVAEFVKEIKSNFAHVDVFVSCAGIDLYKLISETTKAELVNVMNINLNSAYLISGELVKSMVDRRRGKIVFVSSVWGSVGACMETAYSVSKAGLIGLTKALAKEVSNNGVNVNCVCPGVIDTPMNDCFNSAEKQSIKSEIPMNRFGKTEEIAKLVEFLCSEKAEYITGQVVTCDGGYTL